MALILAHRGGNRQARENTVAAFAAARELGADGVELDVRATADGVLVVHHDANVESGRPLAQMVAAELPGWLPSLGEALDACAGFELVNVEIKADDGPPGLVGPELAAAVATALDSRPQQPSLLISSFDLATIDAHRATRPQLATGWLYGVAIPPAEAVAMAADRGHWALHPHHLLVTAALVAAAHEAGLSVVTWTVNDRERATELIALGVDVVISDVPDVVRPRP